jgi:hypothetical protein
MHFPYLQRLELVARVQLAHYLELPLSAVTTSLSEYTTTDIAAACSVAGIKVTQGGKEMVSGGGWVWRWGAGGGAGGCWM